jgi:hypothetical protein
MEDEDDDDDKNDDDDDDVMQPPTFEMLITRMKIIKKIIKEDDVGDDKL